MATKRVSERSRISSWRSQKRSIVERRVDLVEDADRRGVGAEDGENQERGQGLLAAGEQRQRLRLLARRLGDKLEAGFERGGLQATRSGSGVDLKLLEAMERLFDCRFVRRSRCGAGPGPALDEQRTPLAICLEINGCDDLIADEHGQGKISENSLVPWKIGLKAVVVLEE
jgi:hypothetical protein